MARRPRTTTSLVLLVLCVLAVGCTSGGVAAGPLLRDRATRIAGVTIEVDGTDLLIEFTGREDGDILEDPCSGEYELEVNDQLDPMEITIWQLKPTVRFGRQDCTDVGYQRELRVPITGTAPTQVTDGSNDATIPVITLADLLTPSLLPDGWATRPGTGVGIGFGPASRSSTFTDGTSFVSLQTTLVADPDKALDRFRSGSPQPQPVELQGDPMSPTVIPLSPLPFNGTVQEITLRNGTPALAETTNEERRLRFVDGSYLYELSAGLDVPTSVIMTIAEGLE